MIISYISRFIVIQRMKYKLYKCYLITMLQFHDLILEIDLGI